MRNLRADQIAGGAFVVLGIAVFALGWDLPFGKLTAPGAGMLPKLMASLMIVLAAGIMLNGHRAEKVSEIPFGDWRHAVSILAITGIATLLYARLGFLITMSLLVFALLVVVERKSLLPAAGYAMALTLFAYWLFGILLRAPLERGLLWF